MALWGNNNNIDNVGLITGFSYDTKIIFGAGTSFGETGSASVGDIISVGVRSDAGTYYGNVVIVSIAGTQECAIAHTDALVSESIADLSAGDVITVQTYHDSGSTRGYGVGQRCVFKGYKLI